MPLMKLRFLRTFYWLLSLLRERLGYAAALAARACFWKWQFNQAIGTLASGHAVQYHGRQSQRERAMLLLNLSHHTLSTAETITISELPFKDAICLPIVLSTVIPLKNHRTFDTLLSQFNASRVRYFVKNRHAYTLKQVSTNVDVDFAYTHLFKPYAASRHGDGVSHLSRHEVAKMAQITGALHFLYQDEILVGCQIGKPMTLNGKRYWRCIRAGYPESIFSDSQRFGEVHNSNVMSSIEWAFIQGFDFFDIAITLARPFDGVLQWKRSYRGLLCLIGNYSYFHLSLPTHNRPSFFWHTPLVSTENGLLHLQLGLPQGITNESATAYLAMMGFGGLAQVTVYCDDTPPHNISAYLTKLYRHYDAPPNICYIKAH
jgi:hypothetical protein